MLTPESVVIYTFLAIFSLVLLGAIPSIRKYLSKQSEDAKIKGFHGVDLDDPNIIMQLVPENLKELAKLESTEFLKTYVYRSYNIGPPFYAGFDDQQFVIDYSTKNGFINVPEYISSPCAELCKDIITDFNTWFKPAEMNGAYCLIKKNKVQIEIYSYTDSYYAHGNTLNVAFNDAESRVIGLAFMKAYKTFKDSAKNLEREEISRMLKLK